MRAAVVQAFGGADVIQIKELSTPALGAEDVLVRIVYAGVNYSDVYRRMGRIREGHAPTLTPPYVPGSEASGIVAAIGPEVGDLSEGDRVVYGQMNFGSNAEYAVVPGWRLMKVPNSISLETAAAAFVQGSTAYYLSHWVHRLASGETCLVHAGAGGVGQALIQFAKRNGARVLTTVGSSEKAAIAKSAGADVIIPYRNVPFREAVIEATDGAGVDVVYDGVGRDTISESIRCLRRRGLCVLFGVSSGPVPTVETLALAEAGSVFFTRPQLRHYVGTRMELERCSAALFEAIETGALRFLIHRVFPLDEVREAHLALEARQVLGKMLLRMAGSPI